MKVSIFIALAVLAISCNKKSNPTTETKPAKAETELAIDYAKENYTAATVVDMRELDGCGFMLKLEEGKKLQPATALAEEFSVNNTPVWIKYQVKKGAMGICMSGQIVTLNEIVKR